MSRYCSLLSRLFAPIAAFALCVMVAETASAQNVSTHVQYTEYVNRTRTFTALDESLFGDQVNLQDGGISFRQTDVALKTNSDLVVAFGRKSAWSSQGLDAGFYMLGKEWDPDVPYMMQTADDRDGWNSPTRCSNPADGPGSFMGPYPDYYTTVIHPHNYWHGTNINIPGHGEELLLAINGAQQRPTDGQSYSGTTKSNWRISCLPANSESGGEIFVVTLPNGTKYFFDWKVTRNTPDLTDHGMYELPAGDRDLLAPLHDIFLYARRVEDRFGNSLTYNYDPANRQRLKSIVSSDGVRLDVSYTGDRITSVTANGKVWTYGYTSTLPIRLQSLTLPDGSAWTFSKQEPTTYTFTESNFYSDSCKMNPKELRSSVAVVPSAATVFTMTHPSGATGVFRTRKLMHGTNNSPGTCTAVGGLEDLAFVTTGIPPAYGVNSLYSKSISGPGIATRSWTYMYYPSWSSTASCNGSGVCTNNTSQTTVQTADGVLRRITYGNHWTTNQGQLLWEAVESSGVVRQRKDYTFLSSASGQPFPDNVGDIKKGGGCVQCYGNPLRFLIRPVSSVSTTIDGVTLSVTNTAFDAFARPTQLTSSNSLGFTRPESFEFHDDLPNWVLGQQKRNTIGGIEVQRIDFNIKALPWKVFSYGALTTTLSYFPDGTVSTYADGNGNATTVLGWKRGIPTSVRYADNTTQSASVSDDGTIAATTDEYSSTTSYEYDLGLRLNKIIYPTGDTTAWAPTNIVFSQVAGTEYGIPSGHWKSVETTGAGSKTTFFDALWTPILTLVEDVNNSASKSFNVKRFDSNGRLAFQGFATSSLGSVNDSLSGTTFLYDSLGRPTRTTTDSELGALVVTTDYLSQLITRTTNARNYSTTTTYQMFGAPDFSSPILIQAPEGVTTQIARDVFGKARTITRTGPYGGVTDSLTRSYVYDTNERLCQMINPESGASIVSYDVAGNLIWSAEGQTASGATATTCGADRSATASGAKTWRTYDTMNRVTAVDTPGGIADVDSTYYADGRLNTLTAANPGGNNVVTVYTYNRRRLLMSEAVAQPGWYSWTLGYSYNANGHVTSQSYPTGLVINYAPNALGQATQAGSYATGVSYYPNGAMAQFTYGNGIVHTMTQNARGLPARSQDKNGATAILDDSYAFDANGNVTDITDQAQAGATTRGMAYDGLDRLTTAVSSSATMFDTALYTYDALDNLRTTSLGAAGFTHNYDSNNRLVSLARTAGGTYAYTTDARGNITGDGRQSYQFDPLNRLTEVRGKESYRYDGLGRRVYQERSGGAQTLSQYSKAGQLLFRWDNLPSERTREHIYLAGSLVATVDHGWPSNAVTATNYQHTDALGTPVAVTDSARTIIERTTYSPYGAPLNHPVDGVAYTGHVIDVTTGLTYMQQRYYDPQIGRFLSVDPVAARASGDNFNRYSYANNNPYRFTDPDGRNALTKFVKQTVKHKGDVIQATIDVGGDVINIFAPSSTPWDRIESAIALVSPVDVSDLKAIKSGLEKLQRAYRGRKGNADTRAMNQSVANKIKERGGDATTGASPGQRETRFSDGTQSRYSDVSATDAQGRPFEVQTVDTYADGTLTSREVGAAADIARIGDRPVVCISKKCGQ